MLESHKIWSNFEEISKIYRESGHNDETSTYIASKLKKSGFEIDRKPDGTICAFRGVNKARNNAVILQAHMDMVGISEDGNSKKPIVLIEKDGWLYANNRTLGADDGIGVAAILAVAQDPRFNNYPLEMIVTTDEETSMEGARKLSVKDFYGKYLINLDSEKHGVIVKGCAGISQFSLNEKIDMKSLTDNSFIKITVKLSGASGGHSAEIKPDSLNPIKVLLSEFQNIKDAKIVTFSGGERSNAIPRDAFAEFLIPKSELSMITESLKANLEKIKKEKSVKNPEFYYLISYEDAKMGTKYIEPIFQVKILNALNSIPTGILSKFEENNSIKTSQNLGVLNISDGSFQIQISGRSSDIKEKQELQSKTAAILSNLFDKEILVADTTPIWQPINSSDLEKVAVKAFSEISDGKKPKVQIEHGGLEPAAFIEKKHDLEQISIGPTLEEPHSIKERLKIDTVIPFYNWLTKILEHLAN